MYKDPSEFRERFKAYKEGKSVREIYGLPGYHNGKFSAATKKKIDYYYNKLIANGFDPMSAVGILGNMMQESSLDPDSINLLGYSGLLLNSRAIRLAIVDLYGDYSEQSQLRYLSDWTDGSTWIRKGPHAQHTALYSKSYLRKGYKTPEEAAFLFLKRYERAIVVDPKTKKALRDKNGEYIYQDKDKRLGYARDIYDYVMVNRSVLQQMDEVGKTQPERIVATPDALNVSTIPTIEQKSTPSTWILLSPYLALDELKQNFMMATEPMLDSKYLINLIEKTAPTYGTFLVTGMKDGKLPGYQRGKNAEIKQGPKPSPARLFYNEYLVPKKEDSSFMSALRKAGRSVYDLGEDIAYVTGIKDILDIAENKGHKENYINLGIGAATGAGAKAITKAVKSAKVAKAAKKTIKPPKNSAAGTGVYLAGNEYKNGKLPGYKDGTKMQWDADAGVWRQVMDDPYADVFNNLVVTPKYVRPKFEYETNPNYQLPNKNEVVKPDETLWTRQQVEKANNTRTWRSDVADAMKYVQYASDAAGLLYGMAPGIKQRAAKAIYRNIVPASYKDSYLPGGKKQEAINAIKDFFTPKKLDLDNSAYRKWEQENLSLFFTDTDPVAARDEIYRKYLGLPNDDFYYIKNADGTYSHNLTNHEPHDIVTIINNTYNNDRGLSGKNQVLPDMLNSAGGWVNTSLKKANDIQARFKYNDVWDVNPFQDADRVGNVFPKKLLNKYSHIEKLANGEEARVWNKDVPRFIKKLQNFELSDFTNGAPVPVKTDINVRLLNPEEYSYTKKLTDTQIIEKMKQLDLSDAYDLYGDAMSDGIISVADWNEIELRVADKVYDTFYKDPNKYRKMFVYNVNHPLKTLFDWYGPFVLLRGYKDGKISIKPANRGKFNATKKRTGKTTEELTHSKNPLTRKRAIFALNAKKWNHK